MNVLMMMGANLVGFVVGMDGAQYLGYQLVSSWSGESPPSRCTVLPFTYVRAQVFVSSSSHVPVCSSAYSSCSSTGAFVSFMHLRRFLADCFGELELGRKSYVAEYTVDAKKKCFYGWCLIIESLEIYLGIHIPRSFNVHNLPLGLVSTYCRRND
jgi:hypothetical protein